jgi:hypothetical protein
MSNAASNLLALRTEFSTYLCFDAETQALIHLPAQHFGGHALLCTSAVPSQDLMLVTPGQAPVPFPRPPLPVTYLSNGKILLGQDGAQLAVRPSGETVIQEQPAGLNGEFFREPLAETLASANRRRPDSFRFAIFTAAGDRHQIPVWLAGDEPREFALITAYYGASEEIFYKIRAQSDIALRATGGKFQILKTLFIRQPGLLKHFDFILVADDDLIWSTTAINRAFRLSEIFDLWLCQPAFDPSSRISYAITAQFPGPHTLRYVNFVENTCPLFRADKLFSFLNVFDGSMSGYGSDFWFCAALGGGLNLKFAILDDVTVLNPHESTKPGGDREIDRLRPLEARIEEWQAVSRNYNIKRIRPRILGAATLDSQALAAAASP